MRKKTIFLALGIATAAILAGCGKDDDGIAKKEVLKDHSDYACYGYDDSEKDENGNVTRTFHFLNDTDTIDVSFKVIRNFSMSDYYCGTSVIINDSYGYDRYKVVDTEGNDVIPYDTYTYIERIGDSKYFIESTDDKDNKKYGIVDENNKSIVPNNYVNIAKFPTEDKLFFLALSESGTYNIISEEGKTLLDNIEIDDLESCAYYKSDLSDYGIFCIAAPDKNIVYSEESCKVLINNAAYFNETMLEYYIPGINDNTTCVEIINDECNSIKPVDEDFASCQIYAIKGKRYLYGADNLVMAEYSDNGTKSGTPSEEYIYPLNYTSDRAFILEKTDKYVLKDVNDKEVKSYSKDKYTLELITDYGFELSTEDGMTLVSFDGKILYENIGNDGSTIDDNTRLEDVNGHLIKLNEDDFIVYLGDGDPVVINNHTDNMIYVRNEEGDIFSFSADEYVTFDDSLGYGLFYLTNGNVCNMNGETVYTTEPAEGYSEDGETSSEE